MAYNNFYLRDFTDQELMRLYRQAQDEGSVMVEYIKREMNRRERER